MYLFFSSVLSPVIWGFLQWKVQWKTVDVWLLVVSLLNVRCFQNVNWWDRCSTLATLKLVCSWVWFYGHTALAEWVLTYNAIPSFYEWLSFIRNSTLAHLNFTEACRFVTIVTSKVICYCLLYCSCYCCCYRCCCCYYLCCYCRVIVVVEVVVVVE